jgi:hypothetical protein
MSDKAFDNELARALARGDVEELRRVLAVHHQYSLDSEIEVKREWTDDCDFVISAGGGPDSQDRETALALVSLAAATYDEASYLGLLAAGPLENILYDPDPQMLNRIVAEARKTLRFRWMLSGVWLHAIHPNNVAAIKTAVGDMSMDRNDPLPPRPFV